MLSFRILNLKPLEEITLQISMYDFRFNIVNTNRIILFLHDF